MAALENDPQLREQALLFEAEALKAADKTDDAIRTLEKLAGQEIRTPDAMRGATTLAKLYAEKGDGAKALRTLEAIHQKIALADNIIELNALTVELGDKFYDKQQFKEALACYRYCLAARTDHSSCKTTGSPDCSAGSRKTSPRSALTRPRSRSSQRPITSSRQASQMRKKLLGEFEKLPSITPAIYLRLGRCFYELDRKWEAVVVNQEILDRFKEGPEREPALFGLIVALADVNQPQRAEERCEQYLRDFQNGSNAATVGYLLGAVALQAGDPKAAEAYFSRILETQPKSQFREQIRYLLGNAKFMAGSYEEAITAYKKYLSEFPKGASTEDVKYRIALSALFAGKYQDAMNQLQDYVAKHPNGSFLPDAKYRLAVCKYAASLYDEVIADCQAWEKQFPSNPQLGEVLALLGDACAASDRESAAIPVYIRSYQTATTDEVMNYSLFAASKLLQKQGEWDKVAELFSGFVKDKPDNPMVVSALYWIGKAKAHQGKIDEAKAARRRHDQEIHRRSEARCGRAIDHPTRAALHEEKARCGRKTLTPVPWRQASAQAGSTPPATTDPGAELDRLLASSGERRFRHRQGAHPFCQRRARPAPPPTGRGGKNHRADRKRI